MVCSVSSAVSKPSVYSVMWLLMLRVLGDSSATIYGESNFKYWAFCPPRQILSMSVTIITEKFW